jgi:hypothetical protein
LDWAQATARPLPTEAWGPTDEELAALGVQSRLLLAATLSLYRLNDHEGRQALLALRSLTAVEQMECEVARDGLQVDGAAHPLLTAIARERRLYLSAWAALRLDRA